MICPSIRKTKLNTRAFVRELPDVQLLKGVLQFGEVVLCTGNVRYNFLKSKLVRGACLNLLRYVH